ncbi:tRNA-guanine transglycosylase DpdA [Rheinheimera sp. UJ63]|uniref:tRNA-guanine transglycosylase DpdA n=1 Tax=Rheinheimera sp. UJ63 TaxID=2910157 RepID=UPI001F33663F|nr:tRNA-guanine transglycosylase DpdA [Rheinheimera sp. UJ63]MCF4010627.1 hypothetical protein [Rheinheimera sp. UJ63]
MKKVKFFFPDSHDFVDPTFDFINETNNEFRVIQRDDKYAHEIFDAPVYDGVLVSKAIVEGLSGVKGRYSVAQRQRFFREGIYKFFRLPKSYETIGDCGAFSYVKEFEPPYSVEAVVEFYTNSGFTHGIAMDHIIFDYENADVKSSKIVGERLIECLRRTELNLENASKFLKISKSEPFNPYGVAHGWNPNSFSESVIQLQAMGYNKIALGGMIPLKTKDILEILAKVAEVRKPTTQLHLLGINRLEHISQFYSFGVTSFDSTSPLMQGLKDDKFNYHLPEHKYTSIAIPQVDGNNTMRKLIASGAIDQDLAIKLERICLDLIIQFDQGYVSKETVLDALCEYEKLYLKDAHTKTRRGLMNKVLTDKPWVSCPCNICKEIGIHVMLKRGAARNRRRGFHNLFNAYNTIQKELSKISE